MNNAAATIGHNRTPTADAEDLLDTFERAPETLDAESALPAITLAKQMKLEADGLAAERKLAAEPLRERIADLERPYKNATERLGDARGKLLARLGAYLAAAGRDNLKNSLGLQVYRKRVPGYEVEDPAKLPRKFKQTVPDEAKIEAALKRGEVVPGVRRTETFQIVVV